MAQAAAQRQHLTSVQGIEGYWARKSGGDKAGDTSKVWDGGAKTPDVLGQPPETSDVVLTRPYKPERDGPLAKRLRPQVNKWRTTVTIQDTDPDLVPVGDPTVYSDALLKGLTEPERDASSGETGEITLTFAVSDVT